MIVDVHSHVSPADYPVSPSAASAGRWPCMHRAADRSLALHFGERAFRKLDDRSWDVSRRIEDMDRDGIDIQVLSPLPELLSYWLPAADAVVVADSANHQIAAMCAAVPVRFRGLGTVPLQDVALACDYLRRIHDEFGLAGIEIGSNVNGVMLGDPRFEPFFEAAEALSLSVFVHAMHPVVGQPEGASALFGPLAGFSIDIGMAAASVMMAGLIDRYPGLRIAFSHGGGAMCGMLGRLDTGWDQTGGFDGKAVRRPSDQARALYFDSNVYDFQLLHYLAETRLPGRVFLGTDYPYVIMQQDPAAYLASAGLSDRAAASVRHDCARRFLGETAR